MPALPSSLRDGFKLLLSTGKGEGEGTRRPRAVSGPDSGPGSATTASSPLPVYNYPVAVRPTASLALTLEGAPGNPNIPLKTQSAQGGTAGAGWGVRGSGVEGWIAATTGTQGCGIEGDGGEGIAEEVGTEDSDSGVLSGQASGRTEVD